MERHSKLTFLTGPMNCGKTTELLMRLRRFEIAKRQVFLVRPTMDTRAPERVVESKNGSKRDAITASTFEEAWATICTQTDARSGLVIGIDEVQFFAEPEFVDDVMSLVFTGNVVIVAGLVQKYNMFSENCLDTFTNSLALLGQAHDIVKMNAVCTMCQDDENGVYSHRHGYIYGSESLTGADEVGGTEKYTSLCLPCYRKCAMPIQPKMSPRP